jgi:hypothetical protein
MAALVDNVSVSQKRLNLECLRPADSVEKVGFSLILANLAVLWIFKVLFLLAISFPA